MTPRFIRVAKFVAGLLLAPLFAVALLFALGTTFVLAKDILAARGDWTRFEAQMRHYSNSLETAPDGSLVFHRAPYPVASFLVMVSVSWAVALLLGSMLERLRRDVGSPAGPDP